jgi:hypothetical protein
MQASIKRAWTQWMVVPHDGQRGGLAVASKKAAIALCERNGWEIINDQQSSKQSKGE